MKKLICTTKELNFDPRNLAKMPIPRRVLMIRPTHFHIENAINPHMRKADGSRHEFQKANALTQWNDLRDVYKKLGFSVTTLDGSPGLPDMCFAANQSFPYLDQTGYKKAILSNMFNDVRHQEVAFVGAELERNGYQCEPIGPRRDNYFFESMGDCLWLPGFRFLLGGYGHRTSAEVYEKVSEKTSAPVALFKLTNPRFYHLDTCLSILDSRTALACKEAFSDEGWDLLHAIFPTILQVNLKEADSPQFACNAHCPDGKHVLLQPGSVDTEEQLRHHGFIPVPVETAEFIKSGGSVFCLKLMFF